MLYDFDNDGDSDLVTVDSRGTVRFYENYRSNGFSEVGKPAYVSGYGKMMIQDKDDDGQMDVVVEVAPGVDEIVHVGGTFGIQPLPPSGKRAIRYVLFDHLGSAKMLINDEGNVVWPEEQSDAINKLLPFGQELETNQPGTQTELSYNLNFTNKELDRALKLNYFGSRYYHPDLPRFLSVDPVSGKPGIPLSWNRYLYCRNDPVNYLDPDGEDSITENPKIMQVFLEMAADSGHFIPEDREQGAFVKRANDGSQFVDRSGWAPAGRRRATYSGPPLLQPAEAQVHTHPKLAGGRLSGPDKTWLRTCKAVYILSNKGIFRQLAGEKNGQYVEGSNWQSEFAKFLKAYKEDPDYFDEAFFGPVPQGTEQALEEYPSYVDTSDSAQ